MQSIYPIAKVCHEANKAYCEINGDYSKSLWEAMEDWERKNVMESVEFLKNNPEANTSAIHNNWLETKKADGWRYGEREDEYKQEHPCCAPYDELSEEQQVYYKLITAISRILLD